MCFSVISQVKQRDHLFESLLALSGSSCEHTLTPHCSCIKVALECSCLHLSLGLQKGLLQSEYVRVLSNLILSSLTLADQLCVKWPQSGLWLAILVWKRRWEISLAHAEIFELISAFCEVPIFELICNRRWIISLLGFSSFEITPGFQILTLLHLSLVARQPAAPTLSLQPYYRPVW